MSADLRTRAELLAEIEKLHREIQQCHAKATCCCGAWMNEHDPYAGHSPVSMYSYDMYRLEEKIASQAEVIAQLVEALRYYASYYAWTIGEVEGPNGDYGRRGRAALAFAKGRGHG